MKKFILLSASLLASLLFFTSCDENDITSSYTYLIVDFESPQEGQQDIVEAYLVDKDFAISEIFYLKGLSQYDNNVRAIAEFERKLQYVSVEEMVDAGVVSGTTFSLELMSTYDDTEGSQVLHSETYTVE